MFGAANHAAKLAEKNLQEREAKRHTQNYQVEPKRSFVEHQVSSVSSSLTVDSAIASEKNNEVKRSGFFGCRARPGKSHNQEKRQEHPENIIIQKESVASSASVATAVPNLDGSTELKSVAKKSSKGVPSLIEAKKQKALSTLEGLRKTIELQEDREEALGKQASHDIAEAKSKLRYGNKKAAIRCMKKVKRSQLELEKISGAIETLEGIVYNIESSLNSLDVWTAMNNLQGGTAAVEKLDDLVFDIRDTLMIQQEVNAILNSPVQINVYDDEDLLAELADVAPCAGNISIPDHVNGSIEVEEAKMFQAIPLGPLTSSKQPMAE